MCKKLLFFDLLFAQKTLSGVCLAAKADWQANCQNPYAHNFVTPFFVGSSESMKALERRVSSVALSLLPVLIEGESGTGKEILAEHLHRLRCDKDQFVRVYCGRAEAESNEVGVFSDHGNETGKPWRSLAGTLFLKHVSMLPRGLQQRLLAAIQAGLGAEPGGDGHPPGLRLVSTAVEPLEPLVARGDFLPDLYFRLAVCRLSLPPLRERAKDIKELFLAMMECALPNGVAAVPPPPSRLLTALMRYQWPGNLRELQNFARSYTVSHDPEQIIAEIERRSEALIVSGTCYGRSLKEQVRQASKQLESEIILRALERHRWNRRRAAQTLKISYRALLYKMKECRLREEVAGESD